MEYRYGMRLRGFSPGCQPRGVVRVEDGGKKYHDILVYNRPLTAWELEDYELDDLNPATSRVLNLIITKAAGTAGKGSYACKTTIWTKIKLALFASLTVTMMWHWQVEEAKAEPMAIIATDSVAAPAPEIFFAERIPDGHWVDLGTFKTTWYCNCRRCCGRWAGGPTKTGVMPVAGETVAVDPKVIPLGSMVMVDGCIYWAQDTGKHIKGKRIDVYYNSHSTARDHGEKRQRVFVWRED